ncbi:AAA family ATPase [Falsibacillus pallidus]|uniref:AAA family ATPase n=1 Tax=Falsibacillus pallidus TaxID=493781 RepID=UPI003D996F85
MNTLENIISISDYIEMSFQKRLNIWGNITDSKELRLFGKVSLIGDRFCLFSDPRKISSDHKLQFLENPFDDTITLDIFKGSTKILKELESKEIKVNQYVFFSIEVISGRNINKKWPVNIKADSISKVDDPKVFLDTLNKNIPDLTYLFTDFIVDEEGVLQYVSEPIHQLLGKLSTEVKDLNTKLNSFKEKMKKEKEKIDRTVDKYKRDEMAKVQKEIDELNHLKSKLENENLNKMEKVQAEINNLLEIKNKLRVYNIFQSDKESVEDEISEVIHTQIVTENHLEKLINIQHHMVTDERNPLYYEIDVITQFYAGLKTDQLVVLAGSPGTGKTSLVEGFSKAVSAEYRFIPVQPNWVDKSDLLGFYNPVEKTYVSTPFLDAILEAKLARNQNKLFLICLDEMNLAHIEYYFAEFLSKLQTDRTIQLYSENIKNDIVTELKERFRYFENSINDATLDAFLKEKGQNELENYFQMKKQIHLIYHYPSLLEIPNNIRFVGTINKDATTKDLSPKVVDRSFLMRIDRLNEERMEDLQGKLIQAGYKRGPEYFSSVDIAVIKGKKFTKLKEDLKTLGEELRPFHIELTNRFDRTVMQLIGSGFLDDNNLRDILMSSLVLPRVNADSYEVNLGQLLTVLQSNIKRGMERSKNLLEEMKIYEHDSNKLAAITYWR